MTTRVTYAGAPIALCVAARSLPNPPTGEGGDVTSWSNVHGAIEAFELTVIPAAETEIAAGAMLLAEEQHDTYPEESAAVTVTNGTDTINLAAHGFYTGDGPVRVTATDVPGGLDVDADYWVIRTGTGTLRLATSRANALAGTQQALSSDGTAVALHWVTGRKSTAIEADDVDLDEDTITLEDHGLETGERVQVATTSALPDGLSANTDYFVIVVNEDTIQLAASAQDAADGEAIPLGGTPAGTLSVIHNRFGPTPATVFSLFHLLNGGEAIDMPGGVAYPARVSHRPEVVAYHLVAETDNGVPLTAYVRALRWTE